MIDNLFIPFDKNNIVEIIKNNTEKKYCFTLDIKDKNDNIIKTYDIGFICFEDKEGLLKPVIVESMVDKLHCLATIKDSPLEYMISKIIIMTKNMLEKSSRNLYFIYNEYEEYLYELSKSDKTIKEMFDKLYLEMNNIQKEEKVSG